MAGAVELATTIAALAANLGIFGPNKKKERNLALEAAVADQVTITGANVTVIAKALNLDPVFIMQRLAIFGRENYSMPALTAEKVQAAQARDFGALTVSGATGVLQNNLVPIALGVGLLSAGFLIMRK